MVGKNTQYHRFERSIDLNAAEKLLEVNHLYLPKTGGGRLLDDVSMYLRKREVPSVYGLPGAGGQTKAGTRSEPGHLQERIISFT